ncbi:SAV_915 family protein [Streptacidiphilus sp. MAP5-3]|uniref:SAV_915 family protein n=1 Tax=unclassified Streptacidiphilus TaxID=2643834 RepID=UPI0035199DCE
MYTTPGGRMAGERPTAYWTWQLELPTGDVVRSSVDAVLTVVFLLGREHLAVAVPHMTVRAGTVSAEFAVHGSSLAENAARIAEELQNAGGDSSDRGVSILTDCVGTWVDADGESHREPLLTRVRAEAQDGRLSIAVAAFGDAFLPWDLSGAPQPAVYQRNAPRLAAALAAITVALRSPIHPGDETALALPTAGGAVNRLNADGEVLDLTVPLARLTSNTPLFVPTHPSDDQMVFELLGSPEGPVPVAFTSLDLLIERLGTAQPWAAVRAERFITLMDRLGAPPVRLDPPVVPDARRWMADDVLAYEEEFSRG